MSSEPEQKLTQFFLHSDRQSNRHHAGYSDSEIQEISHLLRDMGYEYWSRPRIYVVLRTINELGSMKCFVDKGITDLGFPFSAESLPHGLRPAAHTRFRGMQRIVLTGGLNLENGQHCHLSKDDLEDEMFPMQLEWKEDLGSGGFGHVYKVIRRGSSKEYALKQIRRKNVFTEALDTMRYIESELEILRKLRGRHFVELIGSYTSLNYVGLITLPVADDNLASFLSKVPESINKESVLWSFFGCLANALAYLHFTLNIRHKNIKPQNILVKGNNILLTDFGMALDWGVVGQGRTTTQGGLGRGSWYCAPEAARDEARKSSSDIWSLGCIYLEMMTVLKGKTIEDMRRFFDNNGSGEQYFWGNLRAISLWVTILRGNGGSGFENEPLSWTETMLQQQADRRPDARALRDLILVSRPDRSGMTYCGPCCQNIEPESSSYDLTPNSASSNNETEVVFRVVDDFDEKDSQSLGMTGLLWAASSGHTEVVSLLLDNGANIKAKDTSARTALHWAAVNGHEGVVRSLLDKEVEINAKDDCGATALLCATTNGYKAVVRLLLEKGAEINAKNNCGWSALHVAAINGHEDVVQWLLDRADNINVDIRDSNDWTPLHWTAQMGYVEVARRLLEKNADPNAKDRYGWTPSRRAGQRGHDSIVQLLENPKLRINHPATI